MPVRIFSSTPFRVLLAVSSLCVMAVTSVTAAEGRIPVWTPGTVIGADGRYIVTRNITGTGAAPIIDITAARVDLDLNGFTLDNTGFALPVISISGPAVEVRIRNGTLRGGTSSIERPAAPPPGRTVVIENIRSMDATGTAAVHLRDIESPVVRHSNFIKTGGGTHGVFLDGVTVFKNGAIEHNTFREFQDAIHVLRASATAIRHNRIEVPFGNGILLNNCLGCLVGENTISDADAQGIFLRDSRGNKLYNNVVHRGELHCILLDVNSHENLLLDNVVRECGWKGFPVPGMGGGNGISIEGDHNHLEVNTSNGNDGCGLFFSGTAAGNTYGRNMSRNNDVGVAGFCAAPGCAGGAAPDCSDAGVGNDTFGDNMMPGPPPA